MQLGTSSSELAVTCNYCLLSKMETSHASSEQEVISYFKTDENLGLTEEQVKRNQEEYGPNGKI